MLDEMADSCATSHGWTDETAPDPENTLAMRAYKLAGTRETALQAGVWSEEEIPDETVPLAPPVIDDLPDETVPLAPPAPVPAGPAEEEIIDDEVPKALPVTGQTHWPITLFAALGILLLAAAVVKRRRERDEA